MQEMGRRMGGTAFILKMRRVIFLSRTCSTKGRIPSIFFFLILKNKSESLPSLDFVSSEVTLKTVLDLDLPIIPVLAKTDGN